MKTINSATGAVVSREIQQQMGLGSFLRKAFEEGIALKKQYGEDRVFDFSLGNPILEPPPQFYHEMQRLISNPIPHMHGYMVNAGYPETRAEIASHLAKETGLPFTMDDIIMSAGAGGGIAITLRALLDRGDEVIIFAPYFPEYLPYVANRSAVAKIVPADSNFFPDLEALERAITPRTKVIIVNSPNNPSGAVYPEDNLRDMGRIARAKGAVFGTQIFILSDEAYRKLVYDGRKCSYIFGCHPQTISVTSYSKDLSLPGERIGYVALNPECNERTELAAAISFCQRALGFVNAPALMQRIVGRLQQACVDIGEYQRKRDFLYWRLTEMGYSVVKPQGTFYMFPESPVDDIQFTDELREKRVLTVPGTAFGTSGYFRIAFCVEEQVLEDSLTGFREVAHKYGLC